MPRGGDEVGERFAGPGAGLTARCSPVSIARPTAPAMVTWPGRSAPPIPATAWRAGGDTGQARRLAIHPHARGPSSPAGLRTTTAADLRAGREDTSQNAIAPGDVSAASGAPASFQEWPRRPKECRGRQTQAVPRTRSLDTTRQCRGAVQQAMLHRAMRIRCAVQNVIACQARPPFSVSSSCPSMSP